MLESELEKLLRDEVGRRHGLCLKMVSPSVRGFPDRLVIFKIKKGQDKGQAHQFFLELKTDDGQVSAVQHHMHDKMLALGCDVRVLAGVAGLSRFLAYLDKFVL